MSLSIRLVSDNSLEEFMRLPWGVKMLLREPGRFLPAVLAVTFSAVLVSAQSGMLLGFLQTSSRPILRIDADLWIGSRDLAALGFSVPISEKWYTRVATQPEVVSVEPYYYGVGIWNHGDGRVEQCYLVGAHLHEGATGLLLDVLPEQRVLLGRPGAVALFDPDRRLLGLKRGVGAVGEVNGRRVEVVAILDGPNKGAGLMPGLICSIRTARQILQSLPVGEVSYLIAKCRRPEQAQIVADRLRLRYPDMATFTRAEMAARTENYWLTKTRAGLVLAFSAILGLLVGAVITSQTFYSATAAYWRELAVLRALGVPRRNVAGMLLAQALIVGVLGLVLGIPCTLLLSAAGESYSVQAVLPMWLIASIAAVILITAVLSGMFALRALRLVEPAALLR